MFELRRTDNQNPDFLYLVRLLDQDLRARYQEIQDAYDQHNVLVNVDTVVVAYADEQPVGCACFKQFDEVSVEMKRMYVKPEYRRKGISSAILTELEAWAVELGYTTSLLETGDRQPEAVGSYTKQGYSFIPNFPPYEGMQTSICMRKSLTP